MNHADLLLSFQILLQCNTGQALDAMMRATMNTSKSITKNKQCQLLRNIKRNGIGTNDVEYTIRKLKISDHAKRKLKSKLMNAKISDAFRNQKQQAWSRKQSWRECRRIIPRHLLQGYLDIWKKYTDEHARKIEELHKKKLRHILNKWKPNEHLPSDVRGITVKYNSDDFSDEFSTQPRLYGGVQVDEDERVALELPIKYGLYRNVNLTQCKIDIEESLNKLR